jgi:hypothetical protein
MTVSWIISLRAADVEAPFEARVVAACELVRTRPPFAFDVNSPVSGTAMPICRLKTPLP